MKRSLFYPSLSYLSLIIPFFLTSCIGARYPYLTSRVERYDERSFASFALNTPDLNRMQVEKRDQLFIQWNLHHSLAPTSHVLKVSLLYNQQESGEDVRECSQLPLSRKKGTYAFVLKKERELLAYKVEIITEQGSVILSEKHPLWVEKIEMTPLDLEE